MRNHHCLESALLLFAICSSVWGEPKSAEYDVPANDDVNVPLSPMVAKDRDDQIFGAATNARLRALTTDHSDRIAVCAAWHEVYRKASAARSRQAGAVNDARSATDKFVGFVGGRLRVNVPEWWQVHMRGARVVTPGFITFPLADDDFYGPTSPYCRVGPRFLALRGVHVEEAEKRSLLVGRDGDRFRIPIESTVAADAGSPIVAVSATVADGVCYCVIHDEIARRCQLSALRAQDPSVVWSTDVWASGGLVDLEGDSFHFVEVIAARDVVYVFGGSVDCAYIEGFAIADGKPRLRFCTSY